VKRGDHDIERGQHMVIEVEAPVGEDVDLDAVQDRHLGVAFAQPRDRLALTRNLR
jgi:hypothetical protein